MIPSQGQWSSKKVQEFWENVFDTTVEMRDIPTTLYFGAREKDILKKWLKNVSKKRVLKTDLWDEAKNTQLLSWIKRKGGICYGIDISKKVLTLAKARGPYITTKWADVRKMPFKSKFFDYVISIGTVEHTPQTQLALNEIGRVLKPNGIAMISVPVKYDIWGRFIFIGLLQMIGVYKYGFETSYSRTEFARLIDKAGMKILDFEGYLIFPSQIRILDYFFRHINFKPGNVFLGKILKVFLDFERAHPSVSRWGYMAAYKCAPKSS